jgi:hypothetical protein
MIPQGFVVAFAGVAEKARQRRLIFSGGLVHGSLKLHRNGAQFGIALYDGIVDCLL